MSTLHRICLSLLLPAGVVSAQTIPPPVPSVLKDIHPGTQTSSPQHLTLFRNRVWFSANDGQSGPEIWVSDGTAQGTQLFVDLNPGVSGSNPSDFCVMGDRLYFAAYVPNVGVEMWSTDGTVAGTQLVVDLNPGRGHSYPSELAAIGDRIYFAAQLGNGYEPFVTDGTAAGTVSLGDLVPGPNGSAPKHFAGYPGQVVFQAWEQPNGLGYELFLTDGTAAGTGLLKDINPGSWSSLPEEMFAFGGHVYFAATENSTGRELWRTDFTPAGTVLFQDFSTNYGGGNPRYLQPNFADEGFLFVAYISGHGSELVWCDGTNVGPAWPPGINMQSALPFANPQDIRLVGSRKLYFRGSTTNFNGELHMVNLTRPNPFGLYAWDLNTSGYGSPQEFVALRNLVLFTAIDTAGNRELWVMPNGATEQPVDVGCSGSRLDARDPVIGDHCYYYLETDIPSAAPIQMLGLPLATPVVLPWVSDCPVHVDPGLAVFTAYPAGWHFGLLPIPTITALNGITFVLQFYMGSTTVPTEYDFTNAVYLHLGL